MPRRRGIRTKLAFLLLGAVVMPLLALGGVGVLTSRRMATEATAETYRQIALRAADDIGRSMMAALDVLGAMGHDLRLGRFTREELAGLLFRYARDHTRQGRVAIVDQAGTTLAQSDLVRAEPVAAGDPALVAASNAQRYLGPVTIENHLIPFVRLGVPILGDDGVAGAVVARMGLPDILKLVDEVHVGTTGHILLLDENGVVIAHGDPRGHALVLAHARFAELAGIAHAVDERAGVQRRRGTLDDDVFAIAVPVRGTPWSLVLEQSAAEALTPVARLSWLWLGLIAVAALGATGAGLWAGRRTVTAPLRELMDAAAAFAERRFDHRVGVATGDELEDLGRALERMAAALGDAYAELARTEHARALGLIAAGLGHDLKHPVAALEAVLLRTRGAEPADAQRRLAEAAARELPRLKDLVELLRDVGRAGQRRDVEFPAELLGEAAESVRALAAAKGVAVEVVRPDAGLRVKADKLQLARAVANLLSNAVEATPAGGTIRLAIRPGEAHELEVSVADSGPGLPAPVRERPFEPFVTTGGGLGLGLYVVQRVAEIHGGRAEVSSGPGAGTTITLRLPILVAA